LKLEVWLSPWNNPRKQGTLKEGSQYGIKHDLKKKNKRRVCTSIGKRGAFIVRKGFEE
jgi:hypothetical protein